MLKKLRKIISSGKRALYLQYWLPILFLSLSLLPYALGADRIYRRNGSMLRGRIVEYGPDYYKIETTSGSKYLTIEKVEHDDLEEVIFSQSRSERGYEVFFARLLLGAGFSEYTLSLQGQFLANQDNPNATEPLTVDAPPPVRMALQLGVMALPYSLALYSGLDHTHVNFYEATQPGYSYQSLSMGLSYYLPFHNVYIGLQGRYVLSGSFLYRAKDAFGSELLADIDFPIEGKGLGFGISLGKEWYTTSWLIWGIALTYTTDSLKKVDKLFGRSVNSYTIAESPKGLSYIGIAFTIAYD